MWLNQGCTYFSSAELTAAFFILLKILTSKKKKKKEILTSKKFSVLNFFLRVEVGKGFGRLVLLKTAL